MLLLALAWFGPPFGMGHWHGLGVQLSPDLVRTTGTVVAGQSSSVGTRIFSTPVIEYTVDGQRLKFAGVGREKRMFEVGETVPIAYRKSAPDVVFVRTFDQQFSVPLLMLLFGSPFVLLSVRMVMHLVRER